VDGIGAERLGGFFVGWPNPPSPEAHLEVLRRSDAIVLAVDDETGQVVGFITAITDQVLAAYIPHLEVLPGYQVRGIGRALVERMIATLREIYMIDLLCDPDVELFYERLGFRKVGGMCIRNYHNQSGAAFVHSDTL
jgi:ribosomal protein S18 acetylase RimI-like enzyme